MRSSALKHTLHFSNKSAWVREGIAPFGRNLDNRWEMSGQLHASADLAVQDSLRMTANRRLTEPQGRSGRCIEEWISRSSRELTTHTLVTKPTELVRWWSLSRNRCITNSGLSSCLDFTAIQTSLLAVPKEFPTNCWFSYCYSDTTLKVTLRPKVYR